MEVDNESFLKELLCPVSNDVTVGKTGRFELSHTLASSRVWFHISLHPTDDAPATLANSNSSGWSAGAVSHQESPGSIRRNMPDPVPVMVLGRLAVDQSLQGQHMGAALLQDALNRAASVAQNIGVRALLVHALNERAQQFYSHYGFVPSPLNPMTLMLPLHARGGH